MSKKKSLGSSPIGYKSDNGSKMGFIPDLGVSKPDTSPNPSTPKSRTSSQKSTPTKPNSSSKSSPKKEKPEKKIVSYNLEINVIDRIKSTAKEKEMYYSGLVNKVLKSWLAEN